MKGNINKIIKYGYETITRELFNQGKSDRDIAQILTGLHPDKPISDSSVLRYRNMKPKFSSHTTKGLTTLKSNLSVTIDRAYDYLGATYNKKRICNKLWTNVFDEIDSIIQSEESNRELIENKFKEVIRLIQLDYANQVITPLLEKVSNDNPDARSVFYELHNSFFEHLEGEAE